MTDLNDAAQTILERVPDALSVVVCEGTDLRSHRRTEGTQSELDRLEELFVNAPVTKALALRGSVDGGGFEFALVAWRDYQQVLVPIHGGHVAIYYDRNVDAAAHAPAVLKALAGA